MAKPTRAIPLAAWLSLIVLGAGCGLVPKERLEECHRLTQSLQAETAQLKDQTLTLRAHNQDLAQRAIDDATRIRELDEANQRLERSVLAYQAERDKLSAAFETFKSQLTASVDHVPTALLDQVDDFARRHNLAFDPAQGVLSMPADRLFQPGTDVWLPSARPLLEDLAETLTESGGKALAWQIIATPGQTAEPVQRVSLLTESQPAGELSANRARLVRELLADLSGTNAADIEVVQSGAGDPSAPAIGPAIEIRVHAKPGMPTVTPPPAPR